MRQILEHVIPVAFAALPTEMRAPAAARLILAVGQFSSRYAVRRVMTRTSRRGFWLLEPAQVAEILRFTKGRIPLIEAAAALGYRINLMEFRELQAALEHNDPLACVVARCLLPPHLEDVIGPESTWLAYKSVWQPTGAAADPEGWGEAYEAASVALEL